jgi:hypothetical protein
MRYPNIPTKLQPDDPDYCRWARHYMSSLRGTLTMAARSGVKPIDAIKEAISSGFLACDAGGWFTYCTKMNGESFEEHFEAVSENLDPSLKDSWLNDPLYDRDSAEFLDFIGSPEVVAITKPIDDAGFADRPTRI